MAASSFNVKQIKRRRKEHRRDRNKERNRTVMRCYCRYNITFDKFCSSSSSSTTSIFKFSHWDSTEWRMDSIWYFRNFLVAYQPLINICSQRRHFIWFGSKTNLAWKFFIPFIRLSSLLFLTFTFISGKENNMGKVFIKTNCMLYC